MVSQSTGNDSELLTSRRALPPCRKPRQGSGGPEGVPAKPGPKRSAARRSPVGPQGRGARYSANPAPRLL